MISYTSRFACPAPPVGRRCGPRRPRRAGSCHTVQIPMTSMLICMVLLLGSASARPLAGQAAAQVPERAEDMATYTWFARGLGNDDALVLGGGGARGLAHVGVISALEGIGYDPGIVTGTSMGAIVGALYAAGYPAAEIETLVLERDWPAMFLPMPGLYGPERDVRHPSVRLDLGLGFGELGRGLVADWRINRTLVALLFDAQARARGNFDRLPRRFRAVAADLATGERADLAEGDLPRAVRASMAIPGAFAPVEWPDGRVFVDGAINDYLPVRTALELGAEYIVAADVLLPTPHIASLNPVSVGTRGLRLNLVNSRKGGPAPDVLLVPALDPRLTEMGFPRNPTRLIQAGHDVTVRTLGPTAAARGGPEPRESRRGQADAPSALGRLVVEADDPALAAMARAAFAEVAPGEYSADAVLDAVDRLYETGIISAVWPWTDTEEDSAAAPALRVHLHGIDEAVLDLAIGYENDRGGRAWGAMRRLTGENVPTVLSLAASGDRLDWWASASARILPPRHLPLAWTMGAHFHRADTRDAVDDEALDVLRIERVGGWVGAERRWLSADARRAEPPPFWLGRGRIASASVVAEHVDIEGGRGGTAIGPRVRVTSDEPLDGRIGLPLRLEGEARFGAFRYQRVRASGTLERRPRQGPEARGGFWIGAVADLALARGSAPPDALPALGDDRLVPGLRWGERRGRTRAVVGTDLTYPTLLEGLLFMRIRAGGVADRFTRLGSTDHWLGGAEAGVAWTTPFGAIRFGFGINTDGDQRLDVSLGPVF